MTVTFTTPLVGFYEKNNPLYINSLVDNVIGWLKIILAMLTSA